MTFYLANYQTFDSVQEMDHHVDLYRPVLTKTQFRVLWLLSNYAVKYPGAAHLKAQTIADRLEVSTKTVYRALSALEQAGAIKKHVQYRPISGGQGATIYTVQPFESNRDNDQTTTESKSETPVSENQSAFPINLSSNHVLDTADADSEAKSSDMMDSTILQDSMPTPIFNAITRYFKSATDVYKYYGILLRAKASVCKSTLFEESPDAYVQAWNKCVLTWKTGRIKKSFESLLYVAIQKATLDNVRAAGRDQFENGYANWLTRS